LKAALEDEEAALAASIKAKPKKGPNAKQVAKNNELKELEAQLRAMELEKKKKEEKKKRTEKMMMTIMTLKISTKTPRNKST
jgi:hypothetical protein